MYELDERYDLLMESLLIEYHLDLMIHIKIKLLEYNAATNPIDLVIFMIMFKLLHQTIKLLNARLECGLTRYFSNVWTNLKNICIYFAKSVIIWVVCVVFDLHRSRLYRSNFL